MADNDLTGFKEIDGTQKSENLRAKEFIQSINAEDIADRRHLRWGKTGVTIAMTCVVAVMNWMVIDMLSNVVEQEMHMIAMGVLPPEDRTVTTGVYLALIGGTVAEVSALFFIIVKSMFKVANGDESSDTSSS